MRGKYLPSEPMNEIQFLSWIGAKLLWFLDKLVAATLYLALFIGLVFTPYNLYKGDYRPFILCIVFGAFGLFLRRLAKRSRQEKKDNAMAIQNILDRNS